MSELLTARDAASITRQLLEYEAINRKRELVENLANMGVTTETFRQWIQLDRANSLGVSEALSVDVTNMLSHLEKGIETREDALIRMSDRQIKKFERDAYTRQAAITGESV